MVDGVVAVEAEDGEADGVLEEAHFGDGFRMTASGGTEEVDLKK